MVTYLLLLSVQFLGQKHRKMTWYSNISKKSLDARLIASKVKVLEPETAIHFYGVFFPIWIRQNRPK